MKRFIASGFGVGLFWEAFFKNKKGGGTFASLLLIFEIYFGNNLFGIWNTLNLFILFIVLIILTTISNNFEEEVKMNTNVSVIYFCGRIKHVIRNRDGGKRAARAESC